MTELLPWQHSQWQELQTRRVAGRLPHALLCSGLTGLGKQRFAQYLAQALLCENPTSRGESCHSCRSCRLFIASTHPDLKLVEPGESGKPIKVDQIRELCEFLAYTSQFSGYKIALVAPAEQMNNNAANSLLKTLEEPPANSLLVLVTAFPSRLPATVRSRCQTITFKPPSMANASAWLALQLTGEHDLALLLSLSDGAPLRALSYAKEGRLAGRQALLDNYQKVIGGQLDPIQVAEAWSKGEMAEIIRWLIGWHMDMIRLKMTPDPPRLLNPDLRTPLQRLAAQQDVRSLYRQLDAALRIQALTATPVNTQWMLETFLADCALGS